MPPLTPQKSTKSPADLRIEERRRNSREGFASFDRSMSAQAAVEKPAAPQPTAFLSGLGGSSNAPTVTATRQARKADLLDALPPKAKLVCERFDTGVQVFLNTLYSRHAATGKPIDFTNDEAGALMGLDGGKARLSVEALVSKGIIKPAYSTLGILLGYVPGITN